MVQGWRVMHVGEKHVLVISVIVDICMCKISSGRNK